MRPVPQSYACATPQARTAEREAAVAQMEAATAARDAKHTEAELLNQQVGRLALQLQELALLPMQLEQARAQAAQASEELAAMQAEAAQLQEQRATWLGDNRHSLEQIAQLEMDVSGKEAAKVAAEEGLAAEVAAHAAVAAQLRQLQQQWEREVPPLQEEVRCVRQSLPMVGAHWRSGMAAQIMGLPTCMPHAPLCATNKHPQPHCCSLVTAAHTAGHGAGSCG